MFASIAPRYDLANRLLSFGADGLWRRRLARLGGLQDGQHALDCACGTGDVALALKRAGGSEARVCAVDFCPQMLNLARRKSAARNLPVEYRQADILDLPYPDGSFDLVTIAFGVRNLADVPAGLGEMSRVLKPRGRLLVLEFGQPQLPLFKWPFYLYSRWVLPALGGLLTGSSQPYRYLHETASTFPHGSAFIELLKRVPALGQPVARPLITGVAYLYRAEKRP